MSSTVTGVFPDRDHVRAAVEGLLEEHFESDDMHVLVTDRSGARREVAVRHSQEMAWGGAIGGVAGIVLGGLFTALVALDVIPLEDVGLLARGVGLATVQGVLAGALLGSLTGLIIGMAVWRTVIALVPADFTDAEVLVAARARGRGIDRAKQVLERAGATRIEIEHGGPEPAALGRASTVR